MGTVLALVAYPITFLALYRPARFVSGQLGRALGGAGKMLSARWLPAAVVGLALGLWLVGWAAGLQARARARQRGCNVVIIGVDTLRADRCTLTSADKRDRDLTPNVRRLLASRGTVFTNAISQAPWTLPAFASIFTGLYPEEHGAEHLTSKLSASELTLAELLLEAGYRTMSVVSGRYVSSDVDMNQGFRVFDESQAANSTTSITSEQVTQRALRFLRAHHREPFLLFVHYFDPHYDFRDQPAFDFADHYAGWLRDEVQIEDHIDLLRYKRHLFAAREHAYIRDLYDEEIVYTDAHIGRVLAFLDQAKLWDSTLVIFVADHGEEFFQRGWIGHTITLYQELVHVPLVIATPSREASSVVTRPVETRWLFGTILDFVGLAPPSSLSSTPSLLAEVSAEETLVRSSTHPVRRVRDPGTSVGKRVWLTCLVGERWKLIKDHLTGRGMLFDLLSNPGETRDCSEDRPDLRGELEETLDSWDAQVREGAPTGPRPRVDAEQIRRLKSLGYL